MGCAESSNCAIFHKPTFADFHFSLSQLSDKCRNKGAVDVVGESEPSGLRVGPSNLVTSMG